MSNAIEVKDLTKYYADFLAVDHVRFEVKQGEIFGFLGPNGAGKTTTTKMLTGQTKPSSGTLIDAGLDMLRQPVEAKGSIGVVPENSNVYDEMSAWDNFPATEPLIFGICHQGQKMGCHGLKGI